MRMYKVTFAHTEYGSNWAARTVVVRGYAPDAIAKALKNEGADSKDLRVEEVILIGTEG